MRPALAVLVVFCLGASTCLAQDSAALINKALDEQVKLNLNTVLPRAMEEITRQTGVPLEAQPIVWDLLPWGRDTNINAKIENQTLREALELITRKLGLTFVLKQESVEIQPMPALRRLGRHATVQELAALDLLASTPAKLGADRLTVKQLLEAVDLKLADLKSPFAIENRSGDAIQPDQAITVSRTATTMDALEALVRQTPTTWYPWGKSIIVTTKDDQVRQQLDKTLTMRYRGEDVLQVLMELSARTGVPFAIQPGAIQQVGADSRQISAIFENASARQILEAISGSTGLGYVVKDGEVYIWNQSAQSAAPRRDRIVGTVQLDNGMQAFVPESQVPPDLREYIHYKTQKAMDNIRTMMQEEGFKPTTQPATQTAPAAGREDL